MSPAYSENNPDHVPNPLWQSGVVDTTGTTGDLGGRVENISPVFAQAKADAFANAVDAVEDPDRNEDEVVVFHDGEDDKPSREEAIDTLKQAAEDAKNDPQLQNPADTPAAREAAETSDDDGDGEDGDEQEGDADESELPADDASRARWTEFADANKLDVDQSIKLKADYVAAVKDAYSAK